MVFIKEYCSQDHALYLPSNNPLIYFPASFLSMLSGISKHLFGAYPALLFLVILAGHQSCSARKNSTVYCAPSSCGNIHNISYPFRLSTDPNSCGNKKYKLDCENNRTTLYLKNKEEKYYVQAISYDDSLTAIRLVDANVQKHGCLSIPRHSFMMNGDNIDHYYPYNVIGYGSSFTLVFISCQNPIPCPRFNCVNTSSCKNGSISSNSSRHVEGYSYVMVTEDMYVADAPELCRINLIYDATSPTQQKNITNMSLIDVQDILAYGFELSWGQDACGYIKENGSILDDVAIVRSYCGDPRSTLFSFSLPQITSSEYIRSICYHVWY